MSGTNGKSKSVRSFAGHHSRLTLRGLLVVLIPVVVIGKSIEHAMKTLRHALTSVAPELKVLAGIDIGVFLVLAILGACWLLGWLITRTEIGQRILEWEKRKLLNKTPLAKVEKRVVKLEAKKPEAKKPEAVPSERPALAHVEGGWQPAVIVKEPTDGWTTVFVPEVPAVTSGRLYCLSESQVVPLDVTLDAFRAQLSNSGRGSEAWLRALSSEAETAS